MRAASALGLMKAIGLLLLAELMIALLLIIQHAPAYLTGTWNMDVTFDIQSRPEVVSFPIRYSDSNDSLRSLECVGAQVAGSSSEHIRCKFVAPEISHASDHLETLGIYTGVQFNNVSIWPQWGSGIVVIWSLVLAALILWLWPRYTGHSLREDSERAWRHVRKAPLLLIVPYAAAVTAASIAIVFTGPQGIHTTATTSAPSVGYVALLGSMLLAAPLLEELIFRGVFFDLLRKRIGWLATAVLGSLSFLAMHNLEMIGSSISASQVSALVAASLALFYLREKTNSIVVCISAHFIFNLMALAVQLRSAS